MDDIQQRLKDTSDECVKALAVWLSGKQSPVAREGLLEAVHELRKVAARLEIEMAVSERSEQSHRPMAIPSHRSQTRRPQHQAQPSVQSQSQAQDDVGNELPDFIQQGAVSSSDDQSQATARPRGNFRRPMTRRPQGEE
jgi:hypothetical protein